ncbi:MAG TPA: glycosyltransferase family 1 protein, partial [Anaerolineae bacterium]
ANEYVVFAKPQQAALFQARAHLQIVRVSLPTRLLRIVWEQIRLPALARQYRLDLLHSPHYTMPFLLPCASVVTFHDMTFFLYPQVHKAYKRLFFKSMIRLSAKRASAIIADSESTRRDILRVVPITPQKITAVPLGVSNMFKPMRTPGALEEIRRRYQLPAKIILCVGELQARKNLATLIRAYDRLVQQGLTHSLVIAGRKGWMYDELFQAVQSLNLTDRVIFTGYMPEQDLPLLYNVADVFVYPSLYEGFGLPVLEAMACGIPVVTTNVSSMPEITGDAGVLVDPYDVDYMADAIRRVVVDREIHAELECKGLERARMFSWERTAKETVAVYERIAAH